MNKLKLSGIYPISPHYIKSDDDIQPGTKWEDVPDTWMCPDCGATKSDFDMIEIT